MPEQFTCTRGCKRFGKPLSLASLRGWKTHMHNRHGEFSEEELRSVTQSGEEGAALTGEKDFASFREKMPETADSLRPDAGGEKKEGAPSAPAPPPTADAAKRLKAERVMNRVRSFFERRVKTIFSSIATAQKDSKWNLAKEDAEDITESFDVMMEAFGFEFEVQPYTFKLKSPFWFILYPVAVIALVILSKAGISGLMEFVKQAKEEAEREEREKNPGKEWDKNAEHVPRA